MRHCQNYVYTKWSVCEQLESGLFPRTGEYSKCGKPAIHSAPTRCAQRGSSVRLQALRFCARFSHVPVWGWKAAYCSVEAHSHTRQFVGRHQTLEWGFQTSLKASCWPHSVKPRVSWVSQFQNYPKLCHSLETVNNGNGRSRSPPRIRVPFAWGRAPPARSHASPRIRVPFAGSLGLPHPSHHFFYFIVVIVLNRFESSGL
jgi:hypothetical protein